MPTEQDIQDALSQVMDPELNKDLVSLGMVKQIAVDGASVSVTVELTTPACPLRSEIQQSCEAAIKAVDGVEQVTVEMGARTRAMQPAAPSEEEDLLPGVKNVIIVASGKGGVGKSAVAINLAASLAGGGRSPACWTRTSMGPRSPP